MGAFFKRKQNWLAIQSDDFKFHIPLRDKHFLCKNTILLNNNLQTNFAFLLVF